MLLLDDCISYLRPVHVDMGKWEQWFDLPIIQWRAQDKPTLMRMWHEFMVVAETRIIMGASDRHKSRIIELYGEYVDEWFHECRDYTHKPIRYTQHR